MSCPPSAFEAGSASLRRRLLVRLSDESGIALVMALGIMLVLTITLTTTIFLTSSSARHANTSNAGQKAYALAETGVNNALAVLYAAYESQNLDFYSPGDLLPSTTSPDGSVTWRGTFCLGASGSPALIPNPCLATDWGAWRIFATGSVPNPTGPTAGPVTRTVQAKVQSFNPAETAASSGLWNWIFAGAGPVAADV